MTEADGRSTLREIARKAASLSAALPDGSFGGDAEAEPIRTGGSDRSFFRVVEGGRSAVLLVDRSAEFDYYISIGRFLRECGVPVPEFYGVDGEERTVLMEDLGSVHLEEALRTADGETVLSLYRSALALLARLQTDVTGAMMERKLLAERRFDRDVLLGETDYFRSQFIEGYCPVHLDEGWERERGRLADFLSRQRPLFMHRDFQSRNILVQRGKLRLVDFQTAHRGPGLYDAASLLKDPYHALSRGTRKTLLMEFYYRLTEVGRESGSSFESYTERFVLAGIQRNLQAQAAYAYLGSVKGKKEFLASIEPALELLEEGLSETGEFPSIESSVRSIREKLAERK